MSTTEKRFMSKRVGTNVFEAKPKVSVIIPAYDVADFIREAVESALDQKFREHEVIVINDGSTDTARLEVALQTRLEDIIYIKQRNTGAGMARNTAIEHARGDIIAFLDGDDIWLPEFLSSQYVFMQRNGYDMVYCDAILFGLNSPYRRTFMETAPSTGEANFDSILDFRCNVITSGTMVRKQAVVDAGMFETERVRAHDFHLWLRIARNGGKIGYQRMQLVRHRLHIDSLSGDSISRIEREIDAFQRVRRTIELNEEQQATVERMLTVLEADLAVEQGKSYLLEGQYNEAALAFRVANHHRRSLKLTLITWLTRVAPRTLLKFYKANRADEIQLLPKLG